MATELGEQCLLTESIDDSKAFVSETTWQAKFQGRLASSEWSIDEQTLRKRRRTLGSHVDTSELFVIEAN